MFRIRANTQVIIKLCSLALLVLSSCLQASDNAIHFTSKELNKKTAKMFLSDIKTSKLDYLSHATEVEQVFKLSQQNNWPQIQLEAAAIYAELLFRQENYRALTTHLEYYLGQDFSIENKDLKLLLLETKIKNLTDNNHPNQAQNLAKKLELLLPERNLTQQIIIFRSLAYYYTSIDDLRRTLEVAVNGLEVATEQQDTASKGFFLRKISDAYTYLNEKQKAIEYAKKAVAEYEKTQDKHFTSKAYWSLGNVLLEEGFALEAVQYFKKALNYFKSVNMQKGIAFAQYSIASIEYTLKNYSEALKLANENISLASNAGVFDMQLASMILISDIYIEQGELQKANKVNDDVYLALDKFTRSVYKSDFLSKRYKLKKRMGYKDDAFDAIEKEIFFLKKHLEATSESNIKALQIKYEVKKKEQEITRLAHENAISKFKMNDEYQQKLIWRLSTVITLLLVLSSLLLIYRQVRERKKYHLMASTDFLTSSANRRGILQLAQQIIDKKSATIAIVDLDFFKRINDEFGHDTGDLVLIAFAQAAKETLTKGDQFGRYGGEEWLFILATTDHTLIRETFKQLNKCFIEQCEKLKATHPSYSWPITFSVGATINKKPTDELEALIKKADELLYQAKEKGRNCIIID